MSIFSKVFGSQNVPEAKSEDFEAIFANKIGILAKKGTDLSAHKARVIFVLDHSGSMESHYHNGNIERVLKMLLPVGEHFDDNGEIEVVLFSTIAQRLEIPLTSPNMGKYMSVISDANFEWSGTNYAPAISEVMSLHAHDDKVPTLVFFVTDGDCYDKPQSENLVLDSAGENVFFMFFGIGTEEFKFLKRLDTLAVPAKRPCDNTGFAGVEKLKGLSPEELYDTLDEYVKWLKAPGRAGGRINR